MQASALKAAAGLTNSQTAGAMMVISFNNGSPVHSALVRAKTSCLGRAPAWALVATEDVDAGTSLVDNLISLQSLSSQTTCEYNTIFPFTL